MTLHTLPEEKKKQRPDDPFTTVLPGPLCALKEPLKNLIVIHAFVSGLFLQRCLI